MIIAILFADVDWNNINIGGVATGGGMAALAVTLIPQIPKILEWIDKQIDKRRQFQREERKDAAEMANQLINVMKDIAVTTTQHTDSIDIIQNKTELAYQIHSARQ